jgi:hypothetical protein
MKIYIFIFLKYITVTTYRQDTSVFVCVCVCYDAMDHFFILKVQMVDPTSQNIFHMKNLVGD